MHEHVLMFKKLDSDKEQDSQNQSQNDLATLVTLLSLSCMLPIRHFTANISQRQLEMFSPECLLDEQRLTTKCIT
jgi:hypothetical protein